MHPRTQELLDHLDRNRAELRAAVDSVPPERRGEVPGPDRWSVAEVLEHLSLAERRAVEVITGYLSAAQAGGGLPPEQETSSVLEGMELGFLQDRTRRYRTGHALLPGSGMDAEAAWRALEAARAELRAAVLQGDGLALGEIEHPHPVAGMVNLHEWIALVGGHEARHAAQIREIAETLGA